jgi:hypothetical protein
MIRLSVFYRRPRATFDHDYTDQHVPLADGAPDDL